MTESGEKPPERGRGKRRGSAVWKAARDVFPGKWIRDYGSEPNLSWTRALAKLDRADFDQGLSALAGGEFRFVPTLGEFLARCDPAAGQSRAQRAFNAQVEASAAQDVAAKATPVGRAWLAFQQYEGIIRDAGMTEDEIFEALEPMDLDEMRNQVATWRRQIEAL